MSILIPSNQCMANTKYQFNVSKIKCSLIYQKRQNVSIFKLIKQIDEFIFIAHLRSLYIYSTKRYKIIAADSFQNTLSDVVLLGDLFFGRNPPHSLISVCAKITVISFNFWFTFSIWLWKSSFHSFWVWKFTFHWSCKPDTIFMHLTFTSLTSPWSCFDWSSSPSSSRLVMKYPTKERRQ